MKRSCFFLPVFLLPSCASHKGRYRPYAAPLFRPPPFSAEDMSPPLWREPESVPGGALCRAEQNSLVMHEGQSNATVRVRRDALAGPLRMEDTSRLSSIDVLVHDEAVVRLDIAPHRVRFQVLAIAVWTPCLRRKGRWPEQSAAYGR